MIKTNDIKALAMKGCKVTKGVDKSGLKKYGITKRWRSQMAVIAGNKTKAHSELKLMVEIFKPKYVLKGLCN